VRLATFNVFSGRAPGGGPAAPGALADAVRHLDADVLALQEVDRGQPRSGGTDQAAVAAGAMGAEWVRFEPSLFGTPGGSWVPAGAAALDDAARPAFGVALLSRIPVRAWHRLDLVPARGRYPMPLPARPPRVLWLRDEPRVVVAAELDGLTVACTHLSFVPTASVRQLLAVRRWLAALPGPQVLLGDLNLPAGPVRRLTRWTPLASGPTFPAGGPRVQLDHALGSPGVAALGSRTERLALSDHRALVVDLP
jgi:endonuclease/exonuclease/phosphatase family metal-dependent hydrolase